MSHHRRARVSKLVKEQIGEILERYQFADCGFITVTAAEISPDLKEGRVYVSVIGSAAQQQRAVTALQHYHGEIQRELAQRIVLKYTPRLTFALDETETRAAHIEHILDELDPAAAAIRLPDAARKSAP